MSLVDDIQGKRFGRLVVVGITPGGGNRGRLAVCACDCGGSTIASAYNVKTGHTGSCTCLKKQRVSDACISHGKSHTHLYTVWVGIKGRCYNKRNRAYEYYGGRGVKMVDRWKDSPEVFIAWAESHGYETGLQIDRKDPAGGYSPENCRFVDQNMSSANTRLIRANNKTGFRGVAFIAGNKQYMAYANTHCRRVLSKSGFPTAVAAAMFRDAVCLQKRLPMPLNFPAMTRADAELILKEVNDNGPRNFNRDELPSAVPPVPVPE
jgi:hypothetical protein